MQNPADAGGIAEAKRILEAALLASPEPIALNELKRLFDNEIAVDTLKNLLEELREDWSGRAVELVNLASGWGFQTRAGYPGRHRGHSRGYRPQPDHPDAREPRLDRRRRAPRDPGTAGTLRHHATLPRRPGPALAAGAAAARGSGADPPA